jgi:O-antigen/teichoic acid export membrane protein
MSLTGNAVRHGVGEIGSRVPLVILELLLARLLGPAIYGLWSVVHTVIQYGNFLHFGAISSLARREPALHARNEISEIRALRAAAYGFQILVVLILVGVLAIALCFVNIGNSATDRVLPFVLLTTILMQQVQITAQSCAINEFKIRENARSRIFFSAIFLVLGLAAALWKAPLTWLIFSWTTSLILSSIYLYRAVPSIQVLPSLDLARSEALVRDGFPIFFQGLLRLLISNLDKLVILSFAPAIVLGYYNIGSIAAGLCGMVSSIVMRVSLPNILRQRELDSSLENGKNSIKDTLRLALGGSTFFALAVSAFSPLFILIFLPEYSASIWIVAVLSWAGVMIGFSQAAADLALSLGHKRATVAATFVLLAVMGPALVLAWFIFHSGISVAIVTLPLTFGYALWLLRLCLRASNLKREDIQENLKHMVALGVAMVALGSLFTELQIWQTINRRENVFLFLLGNFFFLILFIGAGIALKKQVTRKAS